MISGGIHPLIETFDPTGCRRADRHCDHLQVANRGCRNRSDSLVRGDQSYRCRAGWREGRQPWRADDRWTAPIPAEIADAIDNAYRSLGTDVAVAVRSSGTTEDAGDSSFAGLNASFTNVIRLRNVLARVNDCWASLYGERVLAYRAEQHLTVEPAWDEVKRFAQDFLEPLVPKDASKIKS